MPWKKDFWEWFEKMYKCGRQSSTTAWKLNIEPCLYNSKATRYCLYDEAHKYPRFTIDVTTSENEIYLECMPF